MRFQLMRDCRRSAAEQRFIYSALEIFPWLKEGERQEIRALVDRLAEGPAEGRALWAPWERTPCARTRSATRLTRRFAVGRPLP